MTGMLSPLDDFPVVCILQEDRGGNRVAGNRVIEVAGLGPHDRYGFSRRKA